LVDVLLQLVEQVVPSTDDPTLVLVVDQVQLVGVPRLLHLLEELFQGHLSLSHQDDILHCTLMPLQVDIPHLTKSQLREHPGHSQLLAKRLPVAILQSVTLELHNQHVHLLVALNQLLDILVGGILPQPGRQVLQLGEEQVHLLA